MLRGIPGILSPELITCMMEMGHADVMVIADANYPAASHGRRVIRMDSVKIPELLEAVLRFFPLDHFIPASVLRAVGESICDCADRRYGPVRQHYAAEGRLLEKQSRRFFHD